MLDTYFGLFCFICGFNVELPNSNCCELRVSVAAAAAAVVAVDDVVVVVYIFYCFAFLFVFFLVRLTASS